MLSDWAETQGDWAYKRVIKANIHHIGLRSIAITCKLPLAAAGMGDPGKYYAVLALDGDEMGKWISGRKTGGVVDKQTHHKFSAKLSAFSLSTARRIVEEDYHGQLVYAGGDDVLAMLPAIEALNCAKSLMAAFRSIQVDKGQLTASVGIAFGHIKEPLQDMIAEAKEAEGRAKKERNRGGWDRDALAITLYKRSGEMVQWGAKFESKAFELLNLFQRHYRPPLDNPSANMPISGKFPHRTVEMLAKFGVEAKITPKLSEIAEAEMKWIIHQQTHLGTGDESKASLETLRISLLDRCRDYLAELCGDDGDGRPLAEFYQLFAMEAFIARQRD